MFDTETFIAEIEKRPAIYDIHSNEYNDREAKARAWDEVCEIMIPKWHALSQLDKTSEERILRGKWRNIRDYFMKELRHQSLHKSESGRKRKKYMYFDRLLFLMANVERKRIKNEKKNYVAECKEEDPFAREEYEVDPLKDDYDMDDLVQDDIAEDYVNGTDDDPNYRYVIAAQAICETAMGSSTYDELPDSILTGNGNDTNRRQIKYRDDEDYDRMFLLSLLPIMRRVPETKKLDVRIEMQRILAQALKGTGSSR